jgi:hypothetical protein
VWDVGNIETFGTDQMMVARKLLSLAKTLVGRSALPDEPSAKTCSTASAIALATAEPGIGINRSEDGSNKFSLEARMNFRPAGGEPLASDAEAASEKSIEAHRRTGFTEIDRSLHFVKKLK